MTVQILEGNEKSALYLCPDCFAAMTNTNLSMDFLSPLQLFSSFLTPRSSDVARDLRCDVCGTTYSRFRETGRFGCANCYEVFGDRLKPLFKKLQYNDSYQGKVPGGRPNGIAALEAKLKQAVAREDYEKAAALKKEIAARKEANGHE